MKDFLAALAKFKVQLPTHDIENLTYSFPAGQLGNERLINVSRIYEQKFNILRDKLY